MDAFAEFEEPVDIPVLKQQPASTHEIAFIAINKFLLHHANQVINCNSDLVQLVEQYARLSIAGSRSAQVRGTISHLERFSDGLVAPRVVQETLPYMKRKLELLDRVE